MVERPERLRAVNLGVAAILARLEGMPTPDLEEATPDELANALDRIQISNDTPKPGHVALEIVRSLASMDVLNNPAVKFVHGDIGGDVYLENLIKWAKESKQKIADEGCEIPEGMSKGDLYRAYPHIHHCVNFIISFNEQCVQRPWKLSKAHWVRYARQLTAFSLPPHLTLALLLPSDHLAIIVEKTHRLGFAS